MAPTAKSVISVKLIHNARGGKSEAVVKLSLSTKRKEALDDIKEKLGVGKSRKISKISIRSGEIIDLEQATVEDMGFKDNFVYDVEWKKRKAAVEAIPLMRAKEATDAAINDAVEALQKSTKEKKKKSKKKKSKKKKKCHGSGEQDVNEGGGKRIKTSKEVVSDSKDVETFTEKIMARHRDEFTLGSVNVNVDQDLLAKLERLHNNQDAEDQRLISSFLNDFNKGKHNKWYSVQMELTELNEFSRLLHHCFSHGQYSMKKSEHSHVLGGPGSKSEAGAIGTFDVTFWAAKGTHQLFYNDKPVNFRGMLLITDIQMIKEGLKILHHRCKEANNWNPLDLRELKQQIIWSVVFNANMMCKENVPYEEQEQNSEHLCAMVLHKKAIAKSFREMLDIICKEEIENKELDWKNVPLAPGAGKWIGKKRNNLGVGF